ncbi:MAG: winged helix-turn-helix transcriptional regulator [Dehalobacter sp. 4CP]|uniref:ArsR/SmtB family transcription factor n=1 Tax=Dehalobacter sp. CP TaxID=2594474 RepID=UPI0013CC9585|nr:winged helix-turn-helix transcriptional regulator [Dehalobacter sp. 4CP]
MDPSFSDYASHFKSLSDELRLNILFHLYQNGEKCVCELTDYFKISQSALSYHLKILSDNELLIKRQEAVWNLYSLNKEHFMFPILKSIFKNQIKVLADTSGK